MSHSNWSVVRRRSTAAEFHALPIPEPVEAEIWIHEITRPALVLGSMQRGEGFADTAACERSGVEVVQRHSGGGAVLLVPGEVVWVDVLLPAGHAGWADDVHRPMVWLGRVLSHAFTMAGLLGTEVHDGAMVRTEHSGLICFDGLGPGELTLDGAKLVGISQRRTRSVARLQCCWYSTYDPAVLASLLIDAPDPSVLSPVATVDADTSALVVDGLAQKLGAAS